MNTYKKVILFCFIIFMTGSIVYSPWEFTYQSQGISQVVKPAGYHLIFNPPAPERNHSRFGVRIDSERYLIQILGIGILFGGIFFLLKDNSQQ